MTLRYVIAFRILHLIWEVNNSCYYSGLVYTPIIPSEARLERGLKTSGTVLLDGSGQCRGLSF
jgi:hypothetical protein